jgi:hypothetical protein
VCRGDDVGQVLENFVPQVMGARANEQSVSRGIGRAPQQGPRERMALEPPNLRLAPRCGAKTRGGGAWQRASCRAPELD